MYMLTAFFISFLLILVDNSLVDDNVGNQSHYNQNGRTAQDALLLTLPVKEHATRITAPITTNINSQIFNKPFMCVYFN